MPIEEAGKIQRALVYYFGSDAASKDILHLRRLTGFPNKKYLQQPIVALLDVVRSDISVNDILQKVKIEEEQYKKHVEFEFRQVKPWVYKEAQEILANEGESFGTVFTMAMKAPQISLFVYL